MSFFQFRWQPTVCNANSCEVAYSAAADTPDNAALQVITQHLDPTLLLAWKIDKGIATSSLGKLTVNLPVFVDNAVVEVEDTVPMQLELPMQLAEAVPPKPADQKAKKSGERSEG